MFTDCDTVHTHFDKVLIHFGTVHTMFTWYDTVHTHFDKVHTPFGTVHNMITCYMKFKEFKPG